MVGDRALLTLAELEEEAARRISAIDAAPFVSEHLSGTQGFTESREPLTAVETTTGNSHLSFSVSVEDAPVPSDDSGGPGARSLTVSATLVVVFLYKLPATQRLAAQRLASEAARRIVGALSAPWPEVAIVCTNRYRPGRPDAGFLPVECRFVVELDEPLWTPRSR